MGSYQATLIAGQVLAFTIPNPCYRFQVTQVGTSTSAATYVTGDGTYPVDPATTPQETIINSTQVVLPGNTGAQVQVRCPMPGSAPFVTLSGAGPTGTTLPEVFLLSTGTPTVVVEW